MAQAKADATTKANQALVDAKAYATEKVSDLANGAVKANADAIAAINNADTGILAQAKADATTKANQALTDAKAYADGLNTAMDSRVDDLESTSYEHASKIAANASAIGALQTNVANTYTKDETNQVINNAIDSALVQTNVDLTDLKAKTKNIEATDGVTGITGKIVVNKGEEQQVVIDAEGITVGLNSTRVDDAGIYAGAHNYNDAATAMSEDGRFKAASGAVRIDADGTFKVGGSGSDANVTIYKDGSTSISAKGEIHAGGFVTTGDVVAQGTITGSSLVSTGDVSATGDISTTDGDVIAGTVSLKDVASKVGQSYEAIYGLNHRLGQLNGKINKVGAGAAALAALHPMDFDPDDKLSFAVGFGNYSGSNATALGAFYRPNEKVMMSVGGTYGNGENMVNMGVSFALDKTNNISNSRTAMAREIVDLREQVATQGQQIAQLVALVQQLAGAAQPVVPGEQLFPDVPQNHWAYEYLKSLVSKGVIEGYPDGTFGGDRTMTRYEFASMLFRAMEQGVVLSEQIRQEFERELGRVRVDRVKGIDSDRNKIERVRVNTSVDRDDYGTKVVQVKH